uniref:myelin protein zero-like protein 3 isoform X3 n=1 Tax=Myxine glutinosa TaxID=7769 RepID=UPI00358EF1F0
MKLHVGWSFCVVALVMISYGPAVTLGIDNLSVAEGKSVTINCTFSPKPGIPFIVWSWKPQREKRREIIFVCREAHTEVMDNHFSGRVSCPCDAFTGNASLVISSVTKQDSGVFYCCVQNSGLTFRHDVQVYIKGVNTHVENALYLLEMLMPIIVLCSAMVIVVTIGWAMLRMKTWASRSMLPHNSILEFYGQFLGLHRRVSALPCTINCGTLYRKQELQEKYPELLVK